MKLKKLTFAINTRILNCSDHELGTHRSARNYIGKLELFTNHTKYMKIYDERLQYLEFYQFNKKKSEMFGLQI